MHGDEGSIVNALRSGARAYVLEKSSASELVDALRAVARGGFYLGSGVSDPLLRRVQRGDLEVGKGSPLESLTSRELQVMRLIAKGKTNKDIAGLLDLAEQTVRSYRKSMMKKLGISNAAGVTRLALTFGLVKPDKHVNHAPSDPPSTIPSDSRTDNE